MGKRLVFLILFSDGLISKVWSWLKTNQQGLAALVAITVLVAFIWKIAPILKEKWSARWTRKHLPHTFGAQLYGPQEIDRATRHYVEPDCQSIDPSGGEEFRQVFAAKENAFKALDHLLFQQSQYRHTLILADAGMGKSSLLINYYARHIRSKRKREFTIGIIPLGIPSVLEQIQKYDDPANTVLFLDALDEDTLAIDDHKQRLADLLQAASGFRHVLITCRTQFFLSDEEIPKDAGIARIGITKAGESHNYLLNKIYLSSLSDSQISLYLRRRFPLWQRGKRKRSRAMVGQMGELSARPMLLAHVDELLAAKKQYRFSYQIYEEMIEAWLTREEKFISKEHLREFCELAAVNVYVNREARKAEKLPAVELVRIADSIAPEVAHWQERERSFLSNRSLLNRDAEGNRKFSHRSIMEYLVLTRLLKFSEKITAPQWTDQMYKFYFQMVHPPSVTHIISDDIRVLVGRIGDDAVARRFRNDEMITGGEELIKFVQRRAIYPLVEFDQVAGWIFFYSEAYGIVWGMQATRVLGQIVGGGKSDIPPGFTSRLRRPQPFETVFAQACMAIHYSVMLNQQTTVLPADSVSANILQGYVGPYATDLVELEEYIFVLEGVILDTRRREIEFDQDDSKKIRSPRFPSTETWGKF